VRFPILEESSQLAAAMVRLMSVGATPLSSPVSPVVVASGLRPPERGLSSEGRRKAPPPPPLLPPPPPLPEEHEENAPSSSEGNLREDGPLVREVCHEMTDSLLAFLRRDRSIRQEGGPTDSELAREVGRKLQQQMQRVLELMEGNPSSPGSLEVRDTAPGSRAAERRTSPPRAQDADGGVSRATAAKRLVASWKKRCDALEARCQEARSQRAVLARRLIDEQHALVAAQELHGRLHWTAASRRSVAESTEEGVREIHRRIKELGGQERDVPPLTDDTDTPWSTDSSSQEDGDDVRLSDEQGRLSRRKSARGTRLLWQRDLKGDDGSRRRRRSSEATSLQSTIPEFGDDAEDLPSQSSQQQASDPESGHSVRVEPEPEHNMPKGEIEPPFREPEPSGDQSGGGDTPRSRREPEPEAPLAITDLASAEIGCDTPASNRSQSLAQRAGIALRVNRRVSMPTKPVLTVCSSAVSVHSSKPQRPLVQGMVRSVSMDTSAVAWMASPGAQPLPASTVLQARANATTKARASPPLRSASPPVVTTWQPCASSLNSVQASSCAPVSVPIAQCHGQIVGRPCRMPQHR